jgi:hypothetical protein
VARCCAKTWGLGKRKGREGRKEVRGGRQEEFVVLVGGWARRKKRRMSQE